MLVQFRHRSLVLYLFPLSFSLGICSMPRVCKIAVIGNAKTLSAPIVGVLLSLSHGGFDYPTAILRFQIPAPGEILL